MKDVAVSQPLLLSMLSLVPLPLTLPLLMLSLLSCYCWHQCCHCYFCCLSVWLSFCCTAATPDAAITTVAHVVAVPSIAAATAIVGITADAAPNADTTVIANLYVADIATIAPGIDVAIVAVLLS